MSLIDTIGGADKALKHVLLLAEDLSRRSTVVDRLAKLGLTVTTATSIPDAIRYLSDRPFALRLVDLAAMRLPIAAVRTLRAKQAQVPLAALFDPDRPLMAAEAIDAGALDVLPWPFDDRDAAAVLVNAQDALPSAAATAAALDRAESLVAQSPAMQQVAELVTEAARVRVGVSVCGEPGTGRTFVGRMIHQMGDPARIRPFVAEDCAGYTPQELECRLFGTTSVGQKPAAMTTGSEEITSTGALYQARGGTLLLRNVVEAPARVQARLARVLRDREAVLMNGKRSIVDLDVQPIATLDSGLDVAVSEGRLRQDLHKHLAQVQIDMPSLRRRREDIPLLAAQLLRQVCVERNIAPKSFSRSVLQVMSAMPWNGNAPELKALLDTLVNTVGGPVIQLENLLEHASLAGAGDPIEVGATLREAKARFERDCISAVLMRHHGRVPEAAKALGIQRTNLYRRIRQLNVARSLLSARR